MLSYLFHQLESSFDYGFWKSFASYVLAGKTILQHYFALVLFDYEVFKHLWKKVVEHCSCCLPIVNSSAKSFFAGPSIPRVFRTSKSFFKPNDEALITTCYSQKRMPLESASILSLFYSTDVEASFSIDESSNIGKFCNCMFGIEFNSFSHEFPFVYHILIINEYLKIIHRERLNEKTRKGCDSLIFATKGEEGNPKRYPRLAFC